MNSGCYRKETHITIIGGGVAGLSAAYYARKNNLNFTLYESSCKIGGNCSTFKSGRHYFDSGAHRFHDKDPVITQEVLKLMPSAMKRVSLESNIFHDNCLLRFPLSPPDMLKNFGPSFFLKALLDIIKGKIIHWKPATFEEHAVNAYGRMVAGCFLLNYSEKLWGVPCSQLSPDASGERLKGLNLITFILNTVSASFRKKNHMEGDFYYPDQGIAGIPEELASYSGPDSIRLNSRITAVHHDGKRITGVEINGEGPVETDEVISTIPISHLVRMFRPLLPDDVMERSDGLQYRHMRLAAFIIARDVVLRSATMYFPDSRFMFTRLYEPKNRSIRLSPPGQSSIVAEVPCCETDNVWCMDDVLFLAAVRKQIVGTGLIQNSEIIGCSSEKMEYAYPVLETGYKEKLAAVKEALSVFENLELSGRNGKFEYSWIHNMMRYGKEIVENYLGKNMA